MNYLVKAARILGIYITPLAVIKRVEKQKAMVGNPPFKSVR